MRAFKWKVPESKAQEKEDALDSMDPLMERSHLEVISRVVASLQFHCLSNHKLLACFHISGNNRGLDLTDSSNKLSETLLHADTALGTGGIVVSQMNKGIPPCMELTSQLSEMENKTQVSK